MHRYLSAEAGGVIVWRQAATPSGGGPSIGTVLRPRHRFFVDRGGVVHWRAFGATGSSQAIGTAAGSSTMLGIVGAVGNAAIGSAAGSSSMIGYSGVIADLGLTAVDYWLPFVVPETPDAPLAMVRSAIRRAAYEYCKASHCWHDFLQSISVMKDVSSYLLPLPSQSEFIDIAQAYLDQRKLGAPGIGKILRIYPPGSTGTPRAIVAYEKSNTVVLYPKPIADGQTLTVQAYLAPTLIGSALPTFLATKHLFPIAEGAKGYLMMMDGYKWSNAAKGQALEARMMMDAAKTRISVIHEMAGGTITARPQRFGG